MDIFGIGPTELIFVILIALIVLGPKDMQKAGRTIGRWLRDLVASDGWRAFRETSREVRNLPNRLMREANLEDMKNEVNSIGQEIKESAHIDDGAYGSWSSPGRPATKPSRPAPPPADLENSRDTSKEESRPPEGKNDRKSRHNA